jgi:hypothetical protein
VELTPVGVRDAGEIERSVTAFARGSNGGLIVPVSGLATVHRELIIMLAARHRLPAVYAIRAFVNSGGLGPDTTDQYPRGGLDGRSELTRTCQKKLPEVSLASEKGYLGWSGNEDAVVWFDEKLTLKTSHEALQSKVGRQAKRFFRFARPLLKELAG